MVSWGVIGFYLVLLVFPSFGSNLDYGSALTKSLLYFEAQRSGKLPHDQRVQWRANSALSDGKSQQVCSFLLVQSIFFPSIYQIFFSKKIFNFCKPKA